MATKNVTKQEQQESAQEDLVGLDHLDDETLARIIEVEMKRYGELKSQQASIAFDELARRSGHDISC